MGGTIEVDAANVVGAVYGGAKLKLVQTGEGWLAPIEKSRRRWKGGLAGLGLVPLSWALSSSLSSCLLPNSQPVRGRSRMGSKKQSEPHLFLPSLFNKESGVHCWSCSMICVVVILVVVSTTRGTSTWTNGRGRRPSIGGGVGSSCSG